MFADADDYFTPDAWDVIDRYVDNQDDIIYFCHKNVLSDNAQIEGTRCYEYNEIMKSNISQEEKESFFRCRHNVPWAKMIKRHFIEKEKLVFDEIKYANDIVFNIKAGCNASKIQLVNETIYVLTEREGSLTSGDCKTNEELLMRAKAHIRMQAEMEKYGYYKDCPAMWFLPTLFRRNTHLFCSALRHCKKNGLSMKRLYSAMYRETQRRRRPALRFLFLYSTITAF